MSATIMNIWRLNQQAARTGLEVCTPALQNVCMAWVRIATQGKTLFDLSPHVRLEDHHEAMRPFIMGAELADHYGRRAHDVDVERI
ncbi:MAG: hypothetical protein ACPGOV_17760 [Magnetovibrionaceae bacterium]